MLNREFNRLLGQRGLDVTKVADLVLSGRAHLTQVLGGTRAGTHTWKRLARVLTKDEYDLAYGFACERRIATATAQGDAAEPAWVYRDKAGAVVPRPPSWPKPPSTAQEEETFLREKGIEIVLPNLVAQQ